MPPQYATAPCKLTFDLLTLKVVSESHVTRATSVPILVFLGLSVLELGPMYATDRRQTETSDKSIIMIITRMTLSKEHISTKAADHDNFYSATLCVSAVFAIARCLSVCLSRCWIVSRRLKMPSNFLFGLVAALL